MTSSTINSDQAKVPLRPTIRSRFRRYIVILIGGAVSLYSILLVFSMTVELIGTDVLPLPNWRRLNSGPLMLQHHLHKLHVGRYALVFGTSRNNMLSPAYLNDPLLNLNFVYGSPSEILNCLRSLDGAQIKNIIKIYILVDYHTLEKGAFRHPLTIGTWQDYLQNQIITFNLHKVANAFETVAINFGAPYSYYVDENGYIVPGYEKIMTQIELPDWLDRNFRLDGLDDLRALDDFIAEKRIPVIFYTSTLPVELIRALKRDFIIRFIRGLAATVPKFYQLTYVPEISSSPRYFTDDSHLNVSGYRKLYLDTNWDRFLTTPENVEEIMVGLDAAFVQKRPNNPAQQSK